MLEWITNLVSAGEGQTAPIVELFSTALQPPFLYFIGIGLLGAIVGVIKSIRRG